MALVGLLNLGFIGLAVYKGKDEVDETYTRNEGLFRCSIASRLHRVIVRCVEGKIIKNHLSLAANDDAFSLRKQLPPDGFQSRWFLINSDIVLNSEQFFLFNDKDASLD